MARLSQLDGLSDFKRILLFAAGTVQITHPLQTGAEQITLRIDTGVRRTDENAVVLPVEQRRHQVDDLL